MNGALGLRGVARILSFNRARRLEQVDYEHSKRVRHRNDKLDGDRQAARQLPLLQHIYVVSYAMR
jgi:hypothetical protein